MAAVQDTRLLSTQNVGQKSVNATHLDGSKHFHRVCMCEIKCVRVYVCVHMSYVLSCLRQIFVVSLAQHEAHAAPWGSKSSKFTNLVNLLKVKNLRIFLLNFLMPVCTAQGGGGSFKDRKPIGEVRCCESWMAEQIHWWIERWLERRPIYLSICMSNNWLTDWLTN